jgi:hypothetical protein
MLSAATSWALAAIYGMEKVLLCLVQNPSHAASHTYYKKPTPSKDIGTYPIGRQQIATTKIPKNKPTPNQKSKSKAPLHRNQPLPLTFQLQSRKQWVMFHCSTTNR